MEESFRRFAAIVALFVEAGALLLIVVGAAEVLVELFRTLLRGEQEEPLHGHTGLNYFLERDVEQRCYHPRQRTVLVITLVIILVAGSSLFILFRDR
ncbi:MAG TPA: hypothetical protein VFS33_01905 [Gemmatimonadales bacterium]|nr:hypothetical protein [Gemmatimonadales bacterium]